MTRGIYIFFNTIRRTSLYFDSSYREGVSSLKLDTSTPQTSVQDPSGIYKSLGTVLKHTWTKVVSGVSSGSEGVRSWWCCCLLLGEGFQYVRSTLYINCSVKMLVTCRLSILIYLLESDQEHILTIHLEVVFTTP